MIRWALDGTARMVCNLMPGAVSGGGCARRLCDDVVAIRLPRRGAATAESRSIEHAICALLHAHNPSSSGSIAVKDIAATLDDDTLEWVSSAHKGLTNFLRVLCRPDADGAFRSMRLCKDRFGMDVLERSPMPSALRVPPSQLQAVVPHAPQRSATAYALSSFTAAVPQPGPTPGCVEWFGYEDVVQALVSNGLIHESPPLPADLASPIARLHPAVVPYIDCSCVVHDAVGPGAGAPYRPRYVRLNEARFPRELLRTMHATHDPVGDYEAYRLGRFLSTAAHTSLSSLRSDPEVGTAVGCDPLLVALSFPGMFALDDNAQPTAMRFVLDDATVVRHLQCASKYDACSIEELEAMLAAKRKALGGSFKFIKVRKMLKRAIQRKRFPMGSPLLNQLVLAYYVYDLLPSGQAVLLDTVRDKLLPPDVREQCGSFALQEFQRLPHLFVVGSSSRAYTLTRVELGDEVATVPQLPELSEGDYLALLSEGLPNKFDSTRSIALATIVNNVPKPFASVFSKWVRGDGIDRFPHIIRVDRTPNAGSDVRVFCDIDALCLALRERMG